MQESERDLILNAAEQQRVNDALDAILATEKFEAAPQMSAFLRYVVNQTVAGNQNRIKAFTVAVDALGKPDSFDPQNDPVVRVLAGRLRAALTAYNSENADAELLITMKPGSYVPTFLKKQSADKESSGATETQTQIDYADSSKVDTQAQDFGVLSEQTIEQPQGPTERTQSATISDEGIEKQQPASHAKWSGELDAGHAEAGNYRPKLLLAAGGLAAVAVMVVMQNDSEVSREPNLQAALIAENKMTMGETRPRPDSPAVHITAVDRGNSLENSLNAVVSGAISQNEQVKVYRILNDELLTEFWPEDYILTLTTLELPDETRVDLQLMEAETGRIVHSQSVRLQEQTFEQLTQKALTQIIDTAKAIVNIDGPLVNDYSSKLAAVDEEASVRHDATF